MIFLFSTFPFSNFLLQINLNTVQLSYIKSLIGCFPNFLTTFCRTFYWKYVKCRDKCEKKKCPQDWKNSPVNPSQTGAFLRLVFDSFQSLLWLLVFPGLLLPFQSNIVICIF